jgi:hypothetical protein
MQRLAGVLVLLFPFRVLDTANRRQRVCLLSVDNLPPDQLVTLALFKTPLISRLPLSLIHTQNTKHKTQTLSSSQNLRFGTETITQP